jgi:hypothetical protein
MRPASGPSYYERLDPQPIEVIEAWGMAFGRGAIIKYVARAGHKPGAEELDDLRKALWFLEREIERCESHQSRANLIGFGDTEPCAGVVIIDDEDLIPDAAPTQPDAGDE